MNKSTTKTLILTTITTIATIILGCLLGLLFAKAGQSATTISEVQVGNVYPYVNTTINFDADSVALVEGTNTSINCTVEILEYNGEGDIFNVNATFYDINGSYSEGTPDDDNYHYTNQNCSLDLSYGDENQLEALCQFNVTYFSNNATWVCEASVQDKGGFVVKDNDSIVIEDLIALDIPPTINYGIVDALTVSWENWTNVTNTGNVEVDLYLHGYGAEENDGNAMNCTSGSIKNISVEYEQYNLTETTPGNSISFESFDSAYINLSNTPSLNDFNIPQRQNDDTSGDDDFNVTYWRIYIPSGVAGTCSGFITFSATAG